MEAEKMNKRIRRESWGSVKELVKAIQEYIKSWNKDSKPFAYMRLISLCLVCSPKRICGLHG
jgi:hypothetical protein